MDNKEIWKDIKEYKGFYMISNLGRVKSLERIIKGRYKPYKKKEVILKNILNSCGYYQVCLYKNGIQKIISIHRLLCIHFLENPNKYEYVNHIDCDTKNNELSNLEWCTPKQNFNHAIKMGNMNHNIYWKKVKRICLKTGETKIYDFVNQTKKDGFLPGCVSRCANGKAKKHKGYDWVFE